MSKTHSKTWGAVLFIVAGITLVTILCTTIVWALHITGIAGWIIASAFGLCLFAALWQARRIEIRAIEKFERRPRTESEAFLSQIYIDSASPDAKIALQIREVFADLGAVPAESLKATDRFYPDMEQLPFYDSIDLMDIIFRLEKKLAIKIMRQDAEPLMALFRTPQSATVGEAVMGVVQVWKK